MKTCAYCGHENEDSSESCIGCGSSLAGEPPGKQFFLPLTGKSPKYRRTFAAIGNLLVLLIGIWKVHVGSVSLVSLSMAMAAPILSFACVWFGVNQRRLVEAVGWVLLVVLVAINLFPIVFFIFTTAFEHWSHP